MEKSKQQITTIRKILVIVGFVFIGIGVLITTSLLDSSQKNFNADTGILIVLRTLP